VQKLVRVLQWAESLVRFVAIGGGIGTIGLFLFILTAIASRIFRFDFQGQVEISEIFLAAIACCSLGFAMLEGTHVRVDALFERLPSRLQTIVESFNLVVAMVFFAIIAYSTADSAHQYYVRMVYTEGTIAIPKWIASSLISLGCIFLCMALIVRMFQLFILKNEDSA